MTTIAAAKTLPQKTVAILGGGITGLSTAYYLRKKFGQLIRPIILGRSPRVGGWIHSIQTSDCDNSHNVFETGPRSMRPAGLPGMNTLDLVEELGIASDVHYVPAKHPAALNRFIYTGGKLVKLPMQDGLKLLFKTVPPFERPLYRAVLRDLLKRRVKDDDDSVYDFFRRRFGRDIAENIIDPLIRGVLAGDPQQISTKFMFRQLYYYEQEYGSVIIGALMNRLCKKPDLIELEYAKMPGHEKIGSSQLVRTAVTEKWAQWTLEEGMEQLPKTMHRNLVENGSVEIKFRSSVKTIKFGESRIEPSDHIEVHYVQHADHHETSSASTPKVGPTASEGILNCDYVISTIPAWRLSKILRKSKPSHPSLWQLLNLISAVDVVVVNLLYKDRMDLLKQEAFGFLVPSCESALTPAVDGLLGVVFDTCSRPQGRDTILTVTMQPSTQLLDPTSGSAEDRVTRAITLARAYLKTTLDIHMKPDKTEVTFGEDCIPQYQVGHFEKVDGVRMFLKAAKLPLSVAGACFDDVSVNDCIWSARKAVEEVPFGDLLQKNM